MASSATAPSAASSSTAPPPAPPGPPAHHRRYFKNFILDRGLQLRFVVVVALVSTAISVTLGYFIWYQRNYATRTIVRALDSVEWISPGLKADITRQLHHSDIDVILRMGAVCVGLMAVLSLFLIVMTHKVAGPLHTISNYLDEVRDGRLPHVRNLRRGDVFHDFFNRFRKMSTSLRSRIEAEADVYGRFIAACESTGVPETGELGHALEELRRRKAAKEAALAGQLRPL